MKNWWIVGILFLALFVSCKEKKETKSVSIDEIIGENEAPKKDTVKTMEIHFFDSLTEQNKRISEVLELKKELIILVDTSLLPDRFAHLNNQKWRGLIEKNQLFLTSWNFKDSIQSKNSFFSWLDCFGLKKSQLLVFQEKKVSNESFQIYLFEKRMLYLTFELPQEEEKIFESITEIFTKDKLLYLVTQNKGQKTAWWTKEEDKWIKIDTKL